jgi:hypothetical protein
MRPRQPSIVFIFVTSQNSFTNRLASNSSCHQNLTSPMPLITPLVSSTINATIAQVGNQPA